MKNSKPDDPERLLYTQRQARQLIPISDDTFKRLVAAGRLHVVRLNPPRGRKYYTRAELLALIEADTTPNNAGAAVNS